MTRISLQEVRRKNAEADRQIDVELERQRRERIDAHKARMVAAMEAEAARVRLTHADIIGAQHVRTVTGWHRVVRVNGKSVSVDTGYSWVDRIPFEKVLEVNK